MFDIIVHYFMQDTVRYLAVESVQPILQALNMRQVSSITIVANVE